MEEGSNVGTWARDNVGAMDGVDVGVEDGVAMVGGCNQGGL